MSVQLNELSLIGQGNTAEIYRINDGRILKLFRKGLPKEVAKFEFDVTRKVQETLTNVPQAYEFVETAGRYGIIYDEIVGTDMIQVVIRSPWKLGYYSKKLAHYHIEIQKKPSLPFSSVHDKLNRDINHVKELTEEEKKSIREYLAGLPERNHLCHFDFHPGNVILRDNQPVVIDWMTACVGDPCADAARTGLLLKNGEIPHAAWVMRMVLGFVKKRMAHIYMNEYIKRTCFSLMDIEKWELPVAAARLREWIPESEKMILVKLVRKRLKKYAFANRLQ
jgi:tRNA A-37 threonylcarbamoyl transferase component Bud32